MAPRTAPAPLVWEGPMRLVENIGRWGTYEGETVIIGGRDLGEEVRKAIAVCELPRVRVTLEVLPPIA